MSQTAEQLHQAAKAHYNVESYKNAACCAIQALNQYELARQRQETDPHGKPANTAGAKLDNGKNRLGLVLGAFANALQAVGQVGTHGATKYTDNGWTQVPNGIERYTDAMYRHQLKEATGEANDPDSKLHHAAHAAWNALARLELILRAQETDNGPDRP